MDRFQVVESFVRVAHGGSFTKAAMQLVYPRVDLPAHHGSGSAAGGASAQPLDPQRQPDEEGSAYLVHCEQLLNDMETAEREIARSGKAPLGTIRVSHPSRSALCACPTR